MRISASQMEVLDQNALARGNRRIADYVEARFPQAFEGRDEPQKIAAIERMREAAAPYGFERDDHVGIFIVLRLMYGPDFVSQPWAAPVLDDALLSPQAKIRTLERRVQAAGVDL